MTKNCPYCAEEIKFDAVKCKHCGEWLNKTSISEYLDAAKSIINKKVDQYKQNQTAHLFLPEANRPIELRETKFFPDHFTFKDRKFGYDDIFGITQQYYSERINGIPSEKTFVFKIHVENEQFVNNSKVIDLTVTTGLLSFNKKQRDLAAVCCKWVEEKTFEKRMMKYIVELQTKNFFNYKDQIVLHNQGDLFIKEKFIINLNKAYANNQIWYGVVAKQILGNSMYVDPYSFRINNSAKSSSFFGLGKLCEFDTSYNRDLFDKMIEKLCKSGSIL